VLTDRHIYCIDRDRLVRAYLEPLLRSVGCTVVFYRASIAFLNDARNLASGCILLDLSEFINDKQLRSGIKDLRKFGPLIVMCEQASVHIAVLAMKAGALDFIEKPLDDVEVVRAAIQTAFEERSGYFQSEAAKATRRISALSTRERQVFDRLTWGHLNKQIAFDLRLSVRTVEVHRAHMLRRLGVRTLSEAIRLAVIANSAQLDC